MKKFIIRFIAYFSIVAIVFFTVLYGSNSYLANKASFNIDESIKYIVLGHSHSECALNDSLINNFKNFSASGESYFYTFNKAKKLLKQNKNLDVIFIELSNNQIIKKNNKWIWGNEYLSERYHKYAPFMSGNDHLLLFKNNYRGFVNSLSISINDNFKRIYKSDYNYSENIGGYLYLERNKMDSLVVAYEQGVNKEIEINDELSLANIAYLRNLIDLCIENDKKVFLIRSPQHKYLASLKNEAIFMKLKDSLFSDIEFLDFNNFNLSNSEFGDFGHLNYKGAKKFSKWFNKLLADDLLNKKDKKEFVRLKLLEQKNNK